MAEPPADDATEELPHAYATALRLERAGAEPALIAAALGIEAESVPAALRLAHSKLEALAEDAGGRHEESGGSRS